MVKRYKRRVSRMGTEITVLSAITSVIGLVAGVFLLSTNITGNAVGNLTNSSVNMTGLILFAIGLISGSFYLRHRK